MLTTVSIHFSGQNGCNRFYMRCVIIWLFGRTEPSIGMISCLIFIFTRGTNETRSTRHDDPVGWWMKRTKKEQPIPEMTSTHYFYSDEQVL